MSTASVMESDKIIKESFKINQSKPDLGISWRTRKDFDKSSVFDEDLGSSISSFFVDARNGIESDQDSYITPSVHKVDETEKNIDCIRKWVREVHNVSRLLSPSGSGSGGNIFGSLIYNNRSNEDVTIPIDVGVTSDFEASVIDLSSRILDSFQSKKKKNGTTNDCDPEIIIKKVAHVPHLMKTILLIEDDDDRNRILNYPIIKMTMLCKYSIMSHKETTNKSISEDYDKTSTDDNVSVSVGYTHHNHHCKSWLIDLLEAGKTPLRRKVVDYFELISNISVKEYTSIRRGNSNNMNNVGVGGCGGTSRNNSSPITMKEMETYCSRRSELISSFGSITNLIPSLILLEDNEIGRVSITSLMRELLDWHLDRAFGLGVVFSDLVYHFMLLVSWRLIVSAEVKVSNEEQVMLYSSENLWNGIICSMGWVSLGYLTFRMVGEIICMFSLSWEVFWKNYMNLWSLSDIMSIFMVGFGYLVSMRVISPENLEWVSDEYFSFVAISIGLLWLKIIGFLKMVNWKLATFILAVVQILKDVLLFMLIVFIVIVAFGDMLYITLSTDDEACPKSDDDESNFFVDEIFNYLSNNITNALSTEQRISLLSKFARQYRNTTYEIVDNAVQETNPFCISPGQSYLTIYRLFIGDFSMENYEETTTTTFLFLLLTFVGIVILLNILIALVNESYEKATLHSERLFGKARMTYVAKIVALEEIVRPRPPYAKNEKNNSTTAAAEIPSSRRVACRYWYGRLTRIFMRIYLAAIAICAVIVNLIAIGSLCEEIVDVYGMSASLMIVIGLPAALMAVYLWLVLISFLITGWGGSSHQDSMEGIGAEVEEVTGSSSIVMTFLRNRQNGPVFKYSVGYPIMVITRRLLGIKGKSNKGMKKFSSAAAMDNKDIAEDEEWHGRLRYLESVMEKKMNAVASTLERRIEESEARRVFERDCVVKQLVSIQSQLDDTVGAEMSNLSLHQKIDDIIDELARQRQAEI